MPAIRRYGVRGPFGRIKMSWLAVSARWASGGADPLTHLTENPIILPAASRTGGVAHHADADRTEQNREPVDNSKKVGRKYASGQAADKQQKAAESSKDNLRRAEQEDATNGRRTSLCAMSKTTQDLAVALTQRNKKGCPPNVQPKEGTCHEPKQEPKPLSAE